MKEKLRIVNEYLKFYFTAKTKYSVHSPWVYNLLTTVIQESKDSKELEKFAEIEKIRKKLIQRSDTILTATPGVKPKTKHKTLGSKIKAISQPAAGARILFRLTQLCNPQSVIELGTAAGIATLYISLAAPKAKIYTIEGDELMAKVAEENFKNQNIILKRGKFADVLPNIIETIDKVDLAFIDGDHGREATLKYYELLTSKTHSKSLIILHDIYWSDDMKKAWSEIISKPEVVVSVDCFHFGLLFFDKKLKKQNFKLR